MRYSQLDLTVLSRVLGFSCRRTFGERAAARRGGTSWELEGTSPRLFMRGPEDPAAIKSS
jgi:hypothetical protein